MTETRAARASHATIHRGHIRADGSLVAACGTVVQRPGRFPLLGPDCLKCWPPDKVAQQHGGMGA